MQNNTSWILVADSSRARIFSTLTDSIIQNGKLENDLHLVQELNHHDSHKKVADAVSEKVASNTTGTFVSSSDPKKVDAANFAATLVSFLEKNRNDHKFGELIIVAPPHFLGLIKQHLPAQLEKLLNKSFAKDYTSEDEVFLKKHLAID